MKNRAWAERGGQSANHSSKRAQRKRILHWLKYCGPLTIQKIVMDTQISRADVAIRLAELVHDGFVEVIGVFLNGKRTDGGPNTYRAVPEAQIPTRRQQLGLFEKVNA